MRCWWHWNGRINISLEVLTSQSKTCYKLCFETQHCRSRPGPLFLLRPRLLSVLRNVKFPENPPKKTIHQIPSITKLLSAKFCLKLTQNVQSSGSEQCWTLKTKTICFLSQTETIWQETQRYLDIFLKCILTRSSYT